MENKQIKIADVLAMLEEGMTRKQINEHFAIKGKDALALWSHPKLKGKKTKQKLSIEIIDDTEDEEVVDNSTTEIVHQSVATPETVTQGTINFEESDDSDESGFGV